MKQALHIFAKDTRYLWKEIFLLLGLAWSLGWAETRLPDAAFVEVVVLLAMNYVIARAIHAEAIPGHNQFWITRPYRWRSLLGAKKLFLVVFISVPILLAQLEMIVGGTFSIAQNLTALACSFVMMLVLVILPVATVAALTDGLVSFFLSEFLLLTTLMVGATLTARAHPRWLRLPAMQPGPEAVAWIRYAFALTVVAIVAALVIYTQYKDKRTARNRLLGTAGFAAAVLVFLFLPSSFVLGFQSMLSKESFDGGKLQVSLAAVAWSTFPFAGGRPAPLGEVSLPFAMQGFGEGVELRTDGVWIGIDGSNGKTWESGFMVPNPGKDDRGVTIMDAYVLTDPSLVAEQSVTVRAKFYLTRFGEAHSKTIAVSAEPVNAIDGLQCSTGLLRQYYCRSLFRWPGRLVYAKFGEGGSETSIHNVSYSPFPAMPGFGAAERHSFSMSGAGHEVTITTLAPLSHFWRDVELRGVRLADFTREAKRRALMPSPGTGPTR